jgi:hypothetical protein
VLNETITVLVIAGIIFVLIGGALTRTRKPKSASTPAD